MIVAGELHIANDGQLVGEPRLAGHVLADVDAGHVGLDRLEVAADLDRRVRLHVVHVDVAGAADEQNHDDRLGARRLVLGAKAEQVAEHQAAEAEAGTTQKMPSGDIVAGGKGVHGRFLERADGGSRRAGPVIGRWVGVRTLDSSYLLPDPLATAQGRRAHRGVRWGV